jgi:hypothetical protein
VLEQIYSSEMYEQCGDREEEKEKWEEENVSEGEERLVSSNVIAPCYPSEICPKSYFEKYGHPMHMSDILINYKNQ